MSESTEDALKPLDMFSTGIERLRSTATWMMTVFGAIGAVLVAGLTLSSIGKLEPDFSDVHNQETQRFIVAMLAFVIGFIVVAVIMWFYAKVLSPDEMVFSDLLKSDKQYASAKSMVDRFGAVKPYQNVEELNEDISQYDGFRKEWLDVEQSLRSDSLSNDEQDSLTKKKTSLENQIKSLGGIIRPARQHVLQVAAYGQAEGNFATAKRNMLIGGVIVAFCIAAFAWSVSGAEESRSEPQSEAATESLLIMPSAGTMTLSESGQKKYAPLLGEACAAQLADSQSVNVLVTAFQGTSYDLVIEPEGDCTVPVLLKEVSFAEASIIPRSLPSE